MKLNLLKSALFVAFTLLLNACATTAKFPTSSVVPAADISAKKKTDRNNNYIIEITARNLASADRLTPPSTNYSIWMVTKSNGIKNIGQLMIKNAKKSTFKTVTPFDFTEIFITAENQGNSTYPAGIEISRTSL
jgi:hypothetical protein